jgi:parallel beta-helix repeat protein
MRKPVFIAILLGGIVLFTGTATAIERHVPSQYPTIQAAINDCNNGDTVIVEPGAYTGEGNRDLDFLGKAITVRSTDPNDPETVDYTIIYCGNATRGFIFDSGEGPNSVVTGFTIQGGSADNGAAIYCDSSGPTISHCVILLNHASGNGGAVYLNNSNAHISDCGIYGNTAVSGGGGGIYCNGGSPTISYCIIGYFGENSAKNGGGIYLNSSNAYISHCQIYGNTATNGSGGGIYLNSSNAAVSHCTLYGNTATNGSGGGIYCYGTGNPKIDNCTIQYNTADPYHGGGIFCRESSPTISNSIVRSNWCKGQRSAVISAPDGGGGGICCQACDAEIVNCTVVDNETDGSVGGVYCYWNGEMTVGNSIIWNNSALNSGPEIGVGYGPVSGGGSAVMTISYSDVKGGQSNAYILLFSKLNWGLGNIDADPCFVNPAGGDYHLSGDSLCIDAGDPNYNPAPGEVDIDGEPRVMGGRVDMGADEFTQTPVIGLSDTNFTFSAILGGPNPGTQVLSIYNAGDDILNWEAAADCNWLTAEPNNGSSMGEPNDVILSVNIAGLGYGTYDCNLTISDPYAANNPQTVQVQLTINECYAGMADYSEWVAVGKPLCWCYPRQCHGDADGKKQGNVAIGYYYVSSNDLDILSACWKVSDPPHGPGIVNLPPVHGVPVACADFKHKRVGTSATGYYRCSSNDLDEMALYWKILEPTKGPGIPANCLPGNLTP